MTNLGVVDAPMHPLWLEELAKMPRRSVTLLYERTGAPFKTTAAVQERLLLPVGACGLSDTEVGSILSMSSEMVRHYGKRARALMIARGAAARVTGGKIMALVGGKPENQADQNG